MKEKMTDTLMKLNNIPKTALWVGIFLILFPVSASLAGKSCTYDADCGSKCGGADVAVECGDPCPRMGISSNFPCYCVESKCVISYNYVDVLQKKNWTIQACQNLSEEPSRLCLTEIAKKEKDTAVCEQIKDSLKKNFCYRDTAIASGHMDMCGKIKDDWQYGLCVTGIAKKNQDAAICQNLQGKQKGLCIYTVAIDTKNLALCNESSIYKYDCEDAIKRK